MRIPSDIGERQQLYASLVKQCLASRMERYEFYKACRNYALFGTINEQGAAYNKVDSTLETLTSFVYAPEGTRFALNVGDAAGPDAVYMAPPLQRELDQQWRMSSTHLRFGQGVYWSLVFGVMLMKVLWKRGIARTYLVEPHQFGVLREDVIDLVDQEAFVNCYTTTRTQLASDLIGNPRRAEILMRAGRGSPGESQSVTFGEGMDRLLLSNPVAGVPGSVANQFGAPGSAGGGTVDGGLAGGYAQYGYAPRVDAELLDMVDLYVWNDETNDYQVVTSVAPGVVVYDRPQSRLSVGGHPMFVPIRADDKLYDYFWGASYVAKLASLQDWRSSDITDVRALNKKQVDPPMSVTGAGGIREEKLQALRSAGGRASFDMPGAKVETHAPKMPENEFATLAQIDAMFDDSAGLGHILQGKGEAGVRSKGQADLMARLGSARPKKRAILVEECAEDVATLILRNVREYSDARFQAEIPGRESQPGSTLQFTASQFTVDFEVKVDAHTSSPIFVEDHRAQAAEMLELHVIDRKTYLEMTNPPNRQILEERLKVIEAKEAEAAKMKMAAEAQRHGGGRPAQD